MLKSIVSKPWVQNSATWLAAQYIRLIKRSTRWTYIGLDHVEPIWESGDGVIMCMWHSRIMITHCGWPLDKQPTSALISKSHDGNLIAETVLRIGRGVIRGSTQREGSAKDRGGTTALKEMIRHIRSNGCVVITPDGPRGPRMRSGEGVIRLAKMTGAKIQPLTVATKNHILFKSWDRFMFPLPFGRGTIIYGQPMSISRKADDDEVAAVRAAFEAEMIAILHQADQSLGIEIVQPADTAKKARAG